MRVQPDLLQARRVIVVSDVHVDEWPHELPDCHQDKRQAFLEFLRWIRRDTDTQHVVINGDLLDIPQKDGRPLLPAYFDVLRALADLYRAGIRVSHILGNHDAGMLGLAAQVRDVAFTVNCPCLQLECGSHRFTFEHGHLLDAWIWAYVEHRLSLLHTNRPTTTTQAMRQFVGPIADAGPVHLPAAHMMAEQTLAALQWEPDGMQFTNTEMRLAISLMALDLFDDFADVRGEDEVFPELDIALAEIKRLGLSPEQLRQAETIPDEALDLFRTIGNVYYAKIPWRRAARYRLRQINNQLDDTVSAIVLGHVHKIDHIQWEEDGAERHYYNNGSWKVNRADFLYIEDGRVTAHERVWTDPLP